MARYKYQGVAKDGNGKVIQSATIAVYEARTTTPADVYTTSSGGSAVDSVSGDTSGFFYFWVDTADYARTQQFKIVVSKTRFANSTYDDLVIFPISIEQIGDYGNNLETAIAAIGSDETTLLINDTVEDLTADVTIPSNLSIDWQQGVPLDGNYTLTIDGNLSAGCYKIFGSSLTTKISSTTWERPIEWFGAVGDGTTNDYNAFLAALKSCTIIGGGGYITINPQKTYILNNGTEPAILLDADNLPDSTISVSVNEELPVFGIVGRGNPGKFSPSGNNPVGGLKFTGSGDGIKILSSTRKWRGQIYIANLNLLGGTAGSPLAANGIVIEQMDTKNTIKNISIAYFTDVGFKISGFATYDNIFEDITSIYNGSYGFHLKCNEQLFLRCKSLRNAQSGVYFDTVSALQWLQGSVAHNYIPQILIGSAERLTIDTYIEGQYNVNVPFTPLDGTGYGMVKFEGSAHQTNIKLRALHSGNGATTTHKEQYIIQFGGSAAIYGLNLDIQAPSGFNSENGDSMAVVGPFIATHLKGAKLSTTKQASVGTIADKTTEQYFISVSDTQEPYFKIKTLLPFTQQFSKLNMLDDTASQAMSINPNIITTDRIFLPWNCSLVGISWYHNASAGTITVTEDSLTGTFSEAISGTASNGSITFPVGTHSLTRNTKFNPVITTASLGTNTRDISIIFYFTIDIDEQDRDS